MSDLAKAFDHGKAFIAFLTCGDPDLETTAAAVRAAAQNGADLIELGIPDLHAKVAAVIAAPQRFCSMPNELRMKTGIAAAPPRLSQRHIQRHHDAKAHGKENRADVGVLSL